MIGMLGSVTHVAHASDQQTPHREGALPTETTPDEPHPPRVVAVETDPIIVTARKREELTIDAPIAVTAIGGGEMEDRGAASLVDVLQDVPSVGIYDAGSSISRIAIRGIASSLGANVNGYYLDELPFSGVTVPISPDVRAWDIDRVEVLRGPQGTLFGDGSLGGTVRILTHDADLQSWEAKGVASVSGTSGGGTNYGIKGAANAPIILGMLAIRLAATHERYDGWIDDDANHRMNVNDQSYDTFRAKLRFDPTDRLTLRGSYWHYKGKHPAGAGTATNDNQLPQSLVLATTFQYDLYGASAEYDLGGGTAFYSYSHIDAHFPQSGLYLGGDISVLIDIETDVHELRFASQGDGPLQWTLGGFLRNARRTDHFDFPLFAIENVDFTSNKLAAIFAEATYLVPSGAFEITAGLRYSHEEVGGFEENSGVVTPDADGDYNRLSPRIIFAWHPRDNSTVYVSAASGFRPGQLQPSTSNLLGSQYGLSFPPVLAPDTVWTYELGGKADLLDEAILIEGAVYYSDWNNVAVQVPIAATGFNGLINSEGIQVLGGEIGVSIRPTAGLKISGAAAYNDATYTGSVPDTGIEEGGTADDIAKFTASASLDYTWQFGHGLIGAVRFAWQHNSRRNFTAFPGYLPGDRIDQINARIGAEYKSIRFSVFADNLTNESGASGYRTVTPLTATENEVTANHLRPRTIGVEIASSF